MKDRDMRIHMLRQMITIRYFEEAVQQAYTKGWMPGLAHLYIGQEAIAVGACSALREDDWITSTHRGHGHLIAKGARLDRMMAEIMGKATGYCRGKGGSMHITDYEIGALGANGIVGGSLGIATGAGLTAKLNSSDRICICFFGDGAVNQGIFHETLNMASTWQLPVIYICENNLYGMSVSTEHAMNIEKISERAHSYGIPGYTIDGNDVLAVYKCVRKAVSHARKGRGPSLIECLTYRWFGHNVGDPGLVYRSKEEIAKWKARCPINLFKALLLEKGDMSEDNISLLEDEVRKEIESAVTFGRESPFPEFDELKQHVFVDNLDLAG
jgi:pyruvate dehydrogenase E1 component alpha subunit